MNEWKTLAAGISAALLCASGTAVGADTQGMTSGHDAMQRTTAAPDRMKPSEAREEAHDAVKHVRKAADVLRKMQASAEGARLLDQAKGVFVVPEFGGVALGLGGRGGAGVLMVRNGTAWSDPVFYDFGTVSIGAQAGAEGGSFVLVLNTERAVDTFMQRNNWSLDANAGLTIVNWSTKGQGSAGLGDVTIWSNSKGLFAGATLGVTDIRFNQGETSAFYGKTVAARDVMKGSVHAANAANVADLRDALHGPGTTTAATSPANTAPASTTTMNKPDPRGGASTSQTRP